MDSAANQCVETVKALVVQSNKERAFAAKWITGRTGRGSYSFLSLCNLLSQICFLVLSSFYIF